MARGENPGQVITLETTLTYDATKDFGHASAGKDLMLAAETSGANVGKHSLAADNARLSGKFLDLDDSKMASVLNGGKPMIMRKTAATINVGDKVIGAGAGKVKASTNANASGYVLEVLESGDNGRILVFWELGE